MSTILSFYRKLDEELYQKIGYTEQPLKASYVNEIGKLIDLEVRLEKGQENTYLLDDPTVHWDAKIHDINFQYEIEINNPKFLFGDNGLTDSDGLLGVAIRWYSRDSSILRIHPVGVIKSTDLDFYQTANFEIEKGILRGKITLETIIYMYRPSANQSVVAGTILGTLGAMNILIDGNSSMFPILEINDPSKPLWWVECYFDDPLYDSFTDDNVAIILNNGHRHSKHLKFNKGISSSPLLLEILASGIQIIIEEVKNLGDWEDILNGHSEPGSIGELIYYFVNTYSWDTSSPKTLLKSIREDFDKRL